MDSNVNTVKLFWTGGWDSTFRLLQLLLYKQKVQTYYIIDPDRLSVRNELKSMQTIKQMISEKYPESIDLLLPTIYIGLDSIKPSFEVVRSYENIIKYTQIGTQYKWLAEFAREHKFIIELCVEKGVGRMNDLLRPVLMKTKGDVLSSYEINNELEDRDLISLFSYFKFPVFGIDKDEMREIALKEDFSHLLERTWFCHKPLRSGKPCGTCTPCTQIMQENMNYRLPLISRYRYYFRVFLSQRHFKIKFPWLYSKLRYLKKFAY